MYLIPIGSLGDMKKTLLLLVGGIPCISWDTFFSVEHSYRGPSHMRPIIDVLGGAKVAASSTTDSFCVLCNIISN